MKRRFLGIVLVITIAAIAGLTAACGDSLLPDGIVAQVGETLITADELDAKVAQEAAAYGITKEAYPDEYEDFYKGMQSYVLQNLVTNAVAAQQSVELGLSVTDEEVQTRYDSYLEYYSGDEEAFKQELAAEGLTIEDLKKDIRDGLLRDKIRTEVVKDLTSVPEAEVATYYETNKDSYYVDPSRELRHILVKPEASGESGPTDADWADALQTAQEVRAKLVAGGDWTALAAEYSDDFSTKDNGGDLGTVLVGEQIKELEDAGFALELDEISQPVKTVYGYEIIQATAITVGGVKTLDEVRTQIEAQLLAEAQEEVWNQWLDQKVALAGVIYRSDLAPEPTTTSESTTTTVPDANAAPDATTTT